jgi:hypothetical protein
MCCRPGPLATSMDMVGAREWSHNRSLGQSYMMTNFMPFRRSRPGQERGQLRIDMEREERHLDLRQEGGMKISVSHDG